MWTLPKSGVTELSKRILGSGKEKILALLRRKSALASASAKIFVEAEARETRIPL